MQSSQSSLQLFDAKTGKWILNVVESKQRFHCALHPDGKRVALGSLDGSVKEIDLATRKTLRTLAGHHRPVAMLAYSPDGRLLASAGWDCDVRVWNVPAK